jgi:hypothetical protein
VALLSAAQVKAGTDSPARALVEVLRARSTEFEAIWNKHPVFGPYCEPKRIQHAEVGLLELYGQTLLDPDQSQALIIFTAAPGSESYEKLKLLSVTGSQRI